MPSWSPAPCPWRARDVAPTARGRTARSSCPGAPGRSTRQPLLDGQIRGRRPSTRRGNRGSPGVTPRLQNAHAMSIAMTYGLAASGRHLACVPVDGPKVGLVREVCELGMLRNLRRPRLRGADCALGRSWLELTGPRASGSSAASCPAPATRADRSASQPLPVGRRTAFGRRSSPRPVAEQTPGGLRDARPAGVPPSAHVVAQLVYQRQVVVLLFGEQRELGSARTLGLEPVSPHPDAPAALPALRCEGRNTNGHPVPYRENR